MAQARRSVRDLGQRDHQAELCLQQLQRLGEATTSLHQIDSDIAILSGQRRTLRTRIQAMELVAPVSGVVLGLRVTSNASVLPPAEPALYIIPTQRPLIVEARISPADVDEVSAGQTARLRILSYDSRQTADIVGTVSKISADVLLDQARTQSYYRAEACCAFFFSVECGHNIRSVPRTERLSLRRGCFFFPTGSSHL